MSTTDTLLIVMLAVLSAACANQAFVTSRWPWVWPWRPMALVYVLMTFAWAAAGTASLNDFAHGLLPRLPVAATSALYGFVAVGIAAIADVLIRRSGDMRFGRNHVDAQIEDMNREDLKCALAEWARAVLETERGYGHALDDYLEDLEIRGILDLYQDELDHQQAHRLALLDDRFREATRELTSTEMFVAGLEEPSEAWWFNRVPKRIVTMHGEIDEQADESHAEN